MKDTNIKLLRKMGISIKNTREQKGISLKELAQKTGIRKEYLKKIEAGNAPRFGTYEFSLISEALNVKMSKLAEGIQNHH